MNIPFHKAHITDDEISGVVDAVKSGWLTMGPKTIEFEKQFGQFVGVKHAVSMNSATSALHLALKAIGLQAGDEVIIPTNTFIATAEVVTYFNAVPVLCDIEADTHNLNVAKIPELINSRTKAIIPVHFAGQPCDMDEIMALAHENNLKVIEDAAHAVPSVYKGRLIGSIGDITCFSFYATKTLSTGEGGMATTEVDDYAKNMKINRLHGISRDAWDRYTSAGSWFYEVVDNGCKYNTTDINSALGLAQLKKVQWMQQQRAKIAARYSSAFAGTAVETPVIKSDRESAWHLYVIKVSNRDSLILSLKDKGIGTSVHFIPVHRQPYYQSKYGYKNQDYPVSESIFARNVSLPIYPDMTDSEIQYVIDNVLHYAR